MRPYDQSKEDDFTLYRSDTMELLGELDRKFDMIFADPPYFLSKGFTMRKGDKVKCFDKGDWDKERSLMEINECNMKWLSMCRNLLKDNGFIWRTGTYHNIHSVETCLMQLGYKTFKHHCVANAQCPDDAI